MIQLKPFSEYPDIDKPRRLMRYVLIWCAEGNVTLVIDEEEYVLCRHQLITITSGQVHYFKKETEASGMILEFSLDFFCKDDSDIELIFHNGLFCHFAMNEVIPIDDKGSIDKMENYLSLIKNELNRQPYQYLMSVHAYTTLILVEINRAKLSHGDAIYKPDALFLKFLEMVRTHFKHHYPLRYYADALQTTELKLNELSKLHTGKTAQHVMYGLLISEAKRLFRYEKLSVKEAAFHLGFHDPFYFSNFFKKHTRQSPTSFKSSVLL